MVFIGIDPGKNGGIVAIERGRVTIAEPMPDDYYGILDTLWQAKGFLKDTRVFIEDVHAMPGQGVTSMFNFGKGFGALLMALTSLDYQNKGGSSSFMFTTVAPQVWQRVMNCKTKGDKNVSKRMAQRLFPKINVTHALADACLIAEYNRRQGR